MKSRLCSRAIRGWQLLIFVGMLLGWPLLTVVWSAGVQEKIAAQRQQSQEHRVYERDARELPILDGSWQQLNNWRVAQAVDQSIVQDNHVAVAGLNNVANGPGFQLASTTYDCQHNDAAPHQIATMGSGQHIHFAWTHRDVIARVDRYVNFNSYNSGTGRFIHGVDGVTITGASHDGFMAYGGFATIDVDDGNRARIVAQQRDYPEQPSGDYCSYYWEQSDQRFAVFTEGVLAGSKGVIGDLADDIVYPHISVDRQAGADFYHVVAHTDSSNDNIVYWRYNGTIWQGPYVIDSTPFLSYNVACDPTSARCALVANGPPITANPTALNQVAYRESATNGDDWGPVSTTGLGDGNRVFITSYSDPAGSVAWTEVVGDYDNAGNLHVVWVEQRYNGIGDQAALKHWDALSNTISTMHQAYWDNTGQTSARKLNAGFPTIGFGDGSTTCGSGNNLNYVYVSFVQFGGNSLYERNDKSSLGYMNGELYLSASNDGGLHWSPAKNLTNTHKPGCDPAWADSCPSENWPSLARTVNDTLHLMYIDDKDAGDAPFGQGEWTFNPVMYYRIPGGTNVQPVCPQIAPNVSAILTDANGAECEYNTPSNTSLHEALILSNLGNAALTGSVSMTHLNPPTGSWLWVTTGPYAIAVGGADLTFPMTMNATGLLEGLYTAQISVTHNDPTKTSPIVFPIDFFVFDQFFCPQYVVLHTRWLELEISNIERVANGPNRTGSTLRGLYRAPRFGEPDSGNNSIYDASLVIARPPVDISRPPDGILDTVVYRYLWGTGNYAKGFRALSDLTVDTSRYGTNAGTVYARATQTTVDSILGVDVEYEFPQNSDSSNFVLINYRISNRTGNAIPGVIVGEAADFDIKSPVGRLISPPGRDKGGVNPGWNLVYQQGADTGGTMPAEKYLAGMTAIQCGVAPRGWVDGDFGSFPPEWQEPFGEKYLYRNLVQTGFDVTPATGELISVLAFEQNINLTPTTVKHFTLGFVTSTAGPGDADLIETTKKAWRYAFGWKDIVKFDTLPPSMPMSYRYAALGSHENGPASGCCGCVISEVADPYNNFTVVPDANPCTGTINFTPPPWSGTTTATFRVSTPVCSGPTYADDWTISIWSESPCNCPDQGDVANNDLAVDVFDVIQVIAIAFSNGSDVQDPNCWLTRGDVVNRDGLVDVFDVIKEIGIAFSSEVPDEPCFP